MENMYLYHYTDIDSLACILNHQTLRFNRLDKVDDLHEVKTKNFPIDLRQFIYVSCWTETKMENIALWNMYTQKLTGVIIALPKNSIEFSNKYKEGNYEYKIIQPEDELIKVDYTNETEIYIDIKHKYISKCCDNKEKFDFIWNLYRQKELNFNQFGLKKSIIWDFQKEWRYRLFILPVPKKINDELATFPNPQILYPDNNLRHIDLKIKKDSLNKMKIILGPNQKTGHKLIVESLLKTNNMQAEIIESKLKDVIYIQ